MVRWSQLVLLVGVTALLAAGCGKEAGDSTSSAQGVRPTPAPTRPPKGPVWKPSANPKEARFVDLVGPKPATWIEHPSTSRMRVANYTVPGRDGNEAAHIVVFYFGPDQGGSINDNILRWQAQFRPGADGRPLSPRIERFEADGMPVTLVEFAGDWMKMGADWYTPDQLFLAAIVESSSGNVFIRFAGQTATVEANREPFVEMVRGLRKES